MSKERLEKVEEIVNIITNTESEEEYNSAVNAFILSHMTWTLERIKELEEFNRILSSDKSVFIEELVREQQQNKRYREALELIKLKTLDIKGDKDTRPFQIFGIASDALEGEE